MTKSFHNDHKIAPARPLGGEMSPEPNQGYFRTGASSPRPLYLTECLLIGPKENTA